MRADRSAAGLDPELADMLAALDAQGYQLGGLPLAAERESFRRLFQRLGGGMADGVDAIDLLIAGADGPLDARLYTPRGEADGGPGLVYFHGGGGVLGDLDCYDAPCSLLAAQSGVRLLSVGYRLAPEHDFPAGFLDAEAALVWAYDHADRIGFDPRRIAIGGDSQGATMALMAAIRLSGRVPIAGLLLVYPGLGIDPVAAEPLLDGYFLDRRAIGFFLAHNGVRGHPDAAAFSPLGKPLAGLPPVYLATAGFDPTIAGGHAFAERCRAEGVPIEYRAFESMIHGFANMAGASSGARAALAEISAWLRSALPSSQS